jgi:hypothetical protein
VTHAASHFIALLLVGMQHRTTLDAAYHTACIGPHSEKFFGNPDLFCISPLGSGCPPALLGLKPSGSGLDIGDCGFFDGRIKRNGYSM